MYSLIGVLMGLKKYVVPLSGRDFLDVKLKVERKAVVDFSLNYRAKIKENFFEIYRVDAAHGFFA